MKRQVLGLCESLAVGSFRWLCPIRRQKRRKGGKRTNERRGSFFVRRARLDGWEGDGGRRGGTVGITSCGALILLCLVKVEQEEKKKRVEKKVFGNSQDNLKEIKGRGRRFNGRFLDFVSGISSPLRVDEEKWRIHWNLGQNRRGDPLGGLNPLDSFPRLIGG